MSNHGRTAWNNMMYLAQGEPSYRERIDQLASITAADMRRYYEQTHTQANSFFIVSGNGTENRQKISAGLENLLRHLPEGERLTLPPRERTTPDTPAVEYREIADIFYSHRFVTKPLTIDEVAAAAVLRSVLNSYLKSSLFGAVWESGLAYGIRSGYSYHTYEAAYLISSSVSAKNAKPLFKLIVRQLKRVLEGKVTSADLAAANKTGEGRLDIALQTPNSLASFYTGDYLVYGNFVPVEEWSALRKSVTVQQLQAIAQKLLQSGEWAQSFVGPISDDEANELHALMATLRTSV
ncbi:MAG: insulinase family protein [Candidatus Saccharimonadales bacterium]